MYERLKSVNHEVCNCVRWKSMYYQTQHDPTVPRSNDDHYWCAMTQTVIGPDGQVVNLDSCSPGRTCFKESF
jgi:hypothetical protein